ncbi:hypothetical protein HaLaN_23455, partial [Haematococcus lacustris]
VASTEPSTAPVDLSLPRLAPASPRPAREVAEARSRTAMQAIQTKRARDQPSQVADPCMPNLTTVPGSCDRQLGRAQQQPIRNEWPPADICPLGHAPKADAGRPRFTTLHPMQCSMSAILPASNTSAAALHSFAHGAASADSQVTIGARHDTSSNTAFSAAAMTPWPPPAHSSGQQPMSLGEAAAGSQAVLLAGHGLSGCDSEGVSQGQRGRSSLLGPSASMAAPTQAAKKRCRRSPVDPVVRVE